MKLIKKRIENQSETNLFGFSVVLLLLSVDNRSSLKSFFADAHKSHTKYVSPLSKIDGFSSRRMDMMHFYSCKQNILLLYNLLNQSQALNCYVTFFGTIYIGDTSSYKGLQIVKSIQIIGF